MPKFALKLGVSLPWLLCETDDEAIDGQDIAFSEEDREWLDLLHTLGATERFAVLQLARTLSGKRPRIESDAGLAIPTFQSPGRDFGRG